MGKKDIITCLKKDKKKLKVYKKTAKKQLMFVDNTFCLL